MGQITQGTLRRPHALHVGLGCALLLWAAGFLAKAETDEKVTPYQVKAAFLFNFPKFVEWPDAEFNRSTAPLVLGIMGDDPFGEVLDRIVQGKSINGHTLTVRRFARVADPGLCHVLFISASEKNRVPEIIGRLAGRPVLLVSEFDGFLEVGGMINFYVESANVKFAINVDSAKQAGLKLSAKLLSVAKVAKPEKR